MHTLVATRPSGPSAGRPAGACCFDDCIASRARVAEVRWKRRQNVRPPGGVLPLSMPSKGVEKKARQRKKKVHRWRVHTAYSIDTQDSSDYLVFFPADIFDRVYSYERRSKATTSLLYRCFRLTPCSWCLLSHCAKRSCILEKNISLDKVLTKTHWCLRSEGSSLGYNGLYK